jgi:hypothetical protein
METIAETLVSGLRKEVNRRNAMSIELRLYIGKTVFTYLRGRVIPHRVTGISFEPIANLKFEDESLEEYYLRRYGFTVKYPDQKVLLCEGDYFLPPQFCYANHPRLRG